MFKAIKALLNNNNEQTLVINGNKLHQGSVLPRNAQEDNSIALFKGEVKPFKVAEYKF